jgi:hypothetical protein
MGINLLAFTYLLQNDTVPKPAMYEMIDISRIGFALLLCCITFLARKYGRYLGQLVQRKFSNGLSTQRNPLDASNENTPIIGETDRTVTVTERAYDEVHVLLLSWQGGDVRFYNQLVELAKVFRDYYNYEEGDSTIEEFPIPSENSKNVLDEKLAQFLKNESPRSLLIIYYGGHGAVNVARRAVWKKWESKAMVLDRMNAKYFLGLKKTAQRFHGTIFKPSCLKDSRIFCF